MSFTISSTFEWNVSFMVWTCLFISFELFSNYFLTFWLIIHIPWAFVDDCYPNGKEILLYFPFENISISLRDIIDLLLVGEVITSTFFNFCLLYFLIKFYSSKATSHISFFMWRTGFFFDNESFDNCLILIVI